MIRHIRLPDFGKYFRTTNRNPIDFEVRLPPNGLHDLIFLNSYLHDATFQVKKITTKNRTLHMPVERIRWELYRGKGGIQGTHSILKITGVLSMQWVVIRNGKTTLKPFRSKEFCIRHLYLTERFGLDSEKTEILFVGHGKNPVALRLILSEYFALRMTDRT